MQHPQSLFPQPTGKDNPADAPQLITHFLCQ